MIPFEPGSHTHTQGELHLPKYMAHVSCALPSKLKALQGRRQSAGCIVFASWLNAEQLHTAMST